MARLSREEKNELLRLSDSPELREDFRKIKENKQMSCVDESPVDLYIKFLSFSNSFSNHARKPFKKMTGDNFIL